MYCTKKKKKNFNVAFLLKKKNSYQSCILQHIFKQKLIRDKSSNTFYLNLECNSMKIESCKNI